MYSLARHAHFVVLACEDGKGKARLLTCAVSIKLSQIWCKEVHMHLGLVNSDLIDFVSEISSVRAGQDTSHQKF